MDTTLSLMTTRAAPLAPYVHAGQTPRAVWDFSAGLYTSGWRLSRASEAYWFAPDGSLHHAAPNVARISGSLEGLGLLLEPASVNRLSPSATLATGLSSVAEGPTVGGVDFITVTDAGDGALEFTTCDIAGLSVSSAVTFSLVVRAGSASSFQLWLGVGTGGSSRVRSTVDLAGPAHVISSNPDGPDATATVKALGNGSYWLTLSGAITAQDAFEQCRIVGVNGSIHYALPQFEAAPNASSVMPAYQMSRAADAVHFSVANGSYSARIRRVAQPDEVIAVTVTEELWSPTLSGLVKSVTLY